jgi:oligo-alginate lyase
MKITYLAVILAAVVPFASAAESVIPLANAGFEEGLAGWSAVGDNAMSAVVPEAAKSGKLGLRVTDTSDTLGSSVASKRFPAVPGRSYEVRFQARAVKGEGIAVYLRFYNAKGEFLTRPELKNQINVPVRRGDTEWKAFSKEGVAPAGSVHVEVWIHSFTKNVVTADFDDLVLVEKGS